MHTPPTLERSASLNEYLKGYYHYALAALGALVYRFPSNHIVVIGVTGTKGKSSTLECLNVIFEEAGMRTALLGTIREKIADHSKPNRRRMTMPGRFYLQRFLSRARDKGCDIAFVEMTSEGARQYRHRFVALDALIFLNLSPEHIESHGSLQAYSDAKFELGLQLQRSRKRPRYMVANAEDAESGRYLTLKVEHILPFAINQVAPYQTSERGGTFVFEGVDVEIRLPGEFSLKNALAAATLARAMDIDAHTIARGLQKLDRIPGRAEEISAGQTFPVIVDYAHTPDSLRAIYQAYPSRRKICVLGSTGGGRDTWKRPVMGEVADEECDHIILTNEDPYNEDPRSIVDMIAHGIKKHTPEIIMDRREAIRKALTIARASDAVIITGKGTDPTIQGPGGKAEPWSDADVAREEIKNLLAQQPSNALSPSRIVSETSSPAQTYLGKEVQLIIDHPKGSTHAEGYTYEAHCGYVEATRTPDGSALEAYFLGDTEGEEARGVAIARIHRTMEKTDLLVVVPPENASMSTEAIENAISFQEKWFKHDIIRAS